MRIAILNQTGESSRTMKFMILSCTTRKNHLFLSNPLGIFSLVLDVIARTLWRRSVWPNLFALMFLYIPGARCKSQVSSRTKHVHLSYRGIEAAAVAEAVSEALVEWLLRFPSDVFSRSRVFYIFSVLLVSRGRTKARYYTEKIMKPPFCARWNEIGATAKTKTRAKEKSVGKVL